MKQLALGVVLLFCLDAMAAVMGARYIEDSDDCNEMRRKISVELQSLSNDLASVENDMKFGEIVDGEWFVTPEDAVESVKERLRNVSQRASRCWGGNPAEID